MKKEYWINIAKFVAIIAVLIDHTNYVLYTSQKIAIASYFSVSLFVLLMGITSYWSYERNFGHIKQKVLKKIKYIVSVYLIASICYHICSLHTFDFEKYVESIIRFNSSAPLYFISLYIQIILISPFVFYSLKISIKKFSYNSTRSFFVYIIHGIGILIFCYFTTNYSNILGIYGGGGKLFGGTYLFLFFIGMVIAENYKFLKGGILGFFIFLTCTIVWWQFECVNWFRIDAKLPFGDGFNPPSITSSIMTLLIAGTIYNITQIIQRYSFFNKILNLCVWLGSHTLYIFLYHRLFLDYILPRCWFLQKNIWIKRSGYMLIMIFGSIAIEYCLKLAKENYTKSLIFIKSMANNNNETRNN